MGRMKSENKNMEIYNNTILNSGTIMNFLDQSLKIKKNGEQLLNTEIMNEFTVIKSVHIQAYVACIVAAVPHHSS